MTSAAGNWKDYLERDDPLSRMLAGKRVDGVPAMPICQDTSNLPFVYQRIVEKWGERLDAAGTDRLPIEWHEYVRIRVEVQREVFEHYTPAPSWFTAPVQATRPGLAGSSVERRDGVLHHVTREGREIPMGQPGRPSAESLRTGVSDVDATWDSTLGFVSFKEVEGWHPVANRVEAFKRGEPVQISAPYDPEALGVGDCVDPEHWIPRRAFDDLGVTGHPSADDILAAGAYDVVQGVVDATGGVQPPYAGCTSPFQNSCYELGFEGLMESMLLEPELVHQATAKYLPRTSPRHEAMKRAGIGIVYMFQMFGDGELFGPKQFEEFVMPVVAKALDFWHERGFRVVYYPMGNATPHLEPMRDLAWDALSLEESRKFYTIDMKHVREIMGPDRVLFGNIPARMIEEGTREQLIEEARCQIAHAGRHGNFVLSCGTPIAPGTGGSRVKLFCELPELI